MFDPVMTTDKQQLNQTSSKIKESACDTDFHPTCVYSNCFEHLATLWECQWQGNMVTFCLN